MVTVMFVVNEWPCFPIQLPAHFHEGGWKCAKSRAPLYSVPAVSARYEDLHIYPASLHQGLDITPEGLCNKHDVQ